MLRFLEGVAFFTGSLHFRVIDLIIYLSKGHILHYSKDVLLDKPWKTYKV